MYVFGGCTSTSTTFNDLWRLDLNKRQWVRPLTMGTYPSPKACASVVCYKDTLVLFGGWTHPSPYPLHQAWRLFNELHIYSIVSNRWTCINTNPSPPSMAGHSATIQGEVMVVFGGLHKTNYMGQYGSSSDVWCFNLETHLWYKQATSETKPHPRYGQSQISIDDNNILILGGCGGPNMVFSDVWLLSMTEPVWTWQKLPVRNQQWSPTHLWCHPACKIGQRVVVFSRNPISNAPALPYSAQWNTPSQLRMNVSNVWIPPREEELQIDNLRRSSDGAVEARPIDRDQNVNGRRGSLQRNSSARITSVASTSSSSGEESEPECVAAGPSTSNQSPDLSPTVPAAQPNIQRASTPPKSYINPTFNDPDGPEPSTSSGIGMAAFRDPSPVVRPGANRNRQRQLESLKRMEERIRSLSRDGRNNNGNNDSSNSSPPRQEPANAAASPTSSPSTPRRISSPTKTNISRNGMTMFVLDISNVLFEDSYVEWLPLRSERIGSGGPEEMILYTLVAGKGELVMFGGIQKDATSITTQAQLNCNMTNTVSNSLYFIAAPRGVI
ncbi:F-box only protein 42 isoform X2 [Anabrus simplex]